MGRRKIAIEPINEERNRTVTFVKRKAGLFKKAHELSILCQVDVAVIIVGHNHKIYEYSSADTRELLHKYQDAPNIQEAKQPHDYGDYEKVSRISEYPGKKKRKLSTKHVKSEVEDQELDDEDDDDDDDDDDQDTEDNNNTPSKPPSKSRSYNPLPPYQQPQVPPMDQTRIQSTFHHQRVLLQQQAQQQQQQQQQQAAQQNYSSLPPLSSFNPSHLKYSQTSPQQQPTPQQAHQVPQQQQTSQRSQSQGATPNAVAYAPSPAYSTTSSNGKGVTSQRPVLRVQIPSSADDTTNNDDEDDDDHNSSSANTNLVKKESAITLTAIESSRTNDDKDRNLNGPPRPIHPGLNTNNNTTNNINSSKSTPISATAPNGLFILPQPQPSPSGSHTNGLFLSPFNQGPINTNPQTRAQTQQAQAQMYNGETPLSALPSKYLTNDLLFASPSNFYSNEWNIPFGTGNTPIIGNRGDADKRVSSPSIAKKK